MTCCTDILGMPIPCAHRGAARGPASPNPARSEPTTAEGRALLDRISPPVGDQVDPEEEWVAEAWAHRNEIEGYILAIEAAAAEAERARIRAAVQAMRTYPFREAPYGDKPHATVLLSAVLAAIDGETR